MAAPLVSTKQNKKNILPLIESYSYFIEIYAEGSNDQKNLVLVQFAVLVLLFAFFLKRHNDEADEDVDHEESNDDYVDEEEDGDRRSTVVQWTEILAVRINPSIHQPSKSDK